MTKNKNIKYKKDLLSSNPHLGGLQGKSNDILINKFVNLLSNNGKKSNSYKLLLKSLTISKSKILSSPYGISYKPPVPPDNPPITPYPFGVSPEPPFYPRRGKGFGVRGSEKFRSSTILAELKDSSLNCSRIPEFSTLNQPSFSEQSSEESYKNIQKSTASRSKALRFTGGKSRPEGRNNTNKVTFHTLEERKYCKPFFYQAIGHIKPSVETRQVRGGGTVYQVPSIIHSLRQERIAMRWLIMSATKRLPALTSAERIDGRLEALTGPGTVRSAAKFSALRTDSAKKSSGQLDFSNRLSQELLNSFQKEGQSRQKRDQTHILATNNRAYVGYRWW